MTKIRLVRADDADELADLVSADRAHLERWVPARPDEFYQVSGQRSAIEHSLADHLDGGSWPGVIVAGERIVGRIGLTGVQGDGFFAATLGYSGALGETGHGHATSAVQQMLEIAFRDLGLHRVDAGTVVTNTSSQAVLERNGFQRLCTAPSYVFVGGRWHDAVLFQKVSDVEPDGG